MIEAQTWLDAYPTTPEVVTHFHVRERFSAPTDRVHHEIVVGSREAVGEALQKRADVWKGLGWTTLDVDESGVTMEHDTRVSDLEINIVPCTHPCAAWASPSGELEKIDGKYRIVGTEVMIHKDDAGWWHTSLDDGTQPEKGHWSRKNAVTYARLVLARD